MSQSRSKVASSSKAAGKKANKNKAGRKDLSALVQAQNSMIASLNRESAKSQQELERRNLALNATRDKMVRRADKLTAYDKAWLQQMLYPELVRSGSALLSPCLSPARAQASHFRIEHVLEGPIADNTTIMVSPTLHPISISAQQPVSANGFVCYGIINLEGEFVGEYFQGENSNENFELDLRGHTVNYATKSAIMVNFDAGDAINVNVSKAAWGEWDVFFYETGTSSWANMGSINVEHGTQTFTAVNAGSAIALGPHAVDSYMPGGIVWYVVNTTGPFTFSTPSTHFPISLALPSNTERFRVTALAAKVTFFGSDIYNQGGLTGARTGPGWTPYTGADGISGGWDTVASLPCLNYDGRTAEGLHGFWIPSDLKEYDFRPYGGLATSHDLSRLWFVTRGLAAEASLRVELDVVVEFYSPSPIYNHDPVPYLSDKYGEILFYLGCANPVGDNPGHLARLGKIAKGVGKAAVTAGEVAAAFL